MSPTPPVPTASLPLARFDAFWSAPILALTCLVSLASGCAKDQQESPPGPSTTVPSPGATPSPASSDAAAVPVSKDAAAQPVGNDAAAAPVGNDAAVGVPRPDAGSRPDAPLSTSDGGPVPGPGSGPGVMTTGPNLFVNPNFDTNLMGWMTLIENPRDTIRFQIDNGDGAVLLHGDDGSNAERRLELFQTRTTNGKPYVVAFDARKISGVIMRPIQVFCEQADPPGMVYGVSTCMITVARSTCRVTCTPPAGVMVKFGLNGGQSNLDFRADNARLNQ